VGAGEGKQDGEMPFVPPFEIQGKQGEQGENSPLQGDKPWQAGAALGTAVLCPYEGGGAAPTEAAPYLAFAVPGEYTAASL
jgi:hypothetical protein